VAGASAVQNLTGQKQTGWTGKLNKKVMQTSFTLNLPAMPQELSGFTSRFASLNLFAPICTNYRLLPPFSREKKIVYFLCNTPQLFKPCTTQYCNLTPRQRM
jgi:hypothetical protein